MDCYGGPQTALNMALHGGLYIDIIMHRYVMNQTALTLAFYGGFYLAIIMDIMKGPKLLLVLPCLEASIWQL
jgi:hypothetical protein